MADALESQEIYGSSLKQLGLAVICIALTAHSGAIAFRLLGNVAPGSFIQFIGYFGLIFFGFGTVMIVWRALTSQGPVITITPEGFRDTRLAAEFVPWTTIKRISTWTYQRQKIIVLTVDPEVEDRLTLTRIARWARGANAKLGADGLCISVQGLKVDYDSLLQIFVDHVEAAKANHEVQMPSQTTSH